MDSQALKEIFLSESEKLLSDLEHGLVTLEDRPQDREVINTIFRAAHTLKSNAGMVGHDSIARLAHVTESLLSQVRDRRLRIDRSLVTLLLRAVDCFKAQVDVRGEYLPVVRLNEVLDCANHNSAGGTPTIVVVESSTRRFGIIADRIIGMEQAVAKPLRSTFGIVASLFREYKKLEAVSGATILGDGNVALILDVPGIERMAFGDVR